MAAEIVGKILGETDKAIKFMQESTGEVLWLPKSQIKYNEIAELVYCITLPIWLAEKSKIDYDEIEEEEDKIAERDEDNYFTSPSNYFDDPE